MRSSASSCWPAWDCPGEAWPPKAGGLLRGEPWCRECTEEAVRLTAWEMPVSSSACTARHACFMAWK